ncbi:MAG: DUF1592 domain-containing protein [Acidobacteria bacterium]|nr:DUF1592 domain-containing protein [Acidobacteriota bacterium]
MKTGALSVFVAAAAACQAASGSFDKTVAPFVGKNCVMCHNAKAKTGGIDFQDRKPADVAVKDREAWERAIAKVRDGTMPPKGLPRPAEADKTAFAEWLTAEFARADRKLPPDPGRVTARRLNRFEYNNTVRDLTGVSFKPADDFPPDDSGYGFDNIGDVLSLSPVLMEKYLRAAGQISRRAIPSDAVPKATIERYRSAEHLVSPRSLNAKHAALVEGEFEVRANVAGQGVKDGKPLTLTLRIDGKDAGEWDVDTTPDKRRAFEHRLRLTPGEHTLEAGLKAKTEGDPVRFRVDNIEVRGPFNASPAKAPASHAKIFICGHAEGAHQAECARRDIADLARRAFRRPVTAAEVEPYVKFFEMARADGDSFEHAMRVPLEAILVSPEFLFRIERDAKPDDPKASHRIGDFELATRLSYFLWASMPDEALFQAARSGALRRPAGLEAQIRRMVEDPKASALVDNFAGQWLELRNLESIQPDPDKFPMFDKELRQAMLTETRMFFSNIVREDRSILDFIDAKYTFLNERLARHYGIEGVKGPEFRRVALDGTHRGGVITQASVLTVSSYPTRTSPVIRGKYILENILNAPPPPPPPNVPSLDASGVGATVSLRKQLEEHRANATCASCHSKMDPLGFGLENYDAIGRWRTVDGKFTIDPAGVLPNGKTFSGPDELKTILLADRDAFARCLTEKMLTYALGRGLERYDKRTVDSIAATLATNDYRFSSLVKGIAESMPFQMRRGDIRR